MTWITYQGQVTNGRVTLPPVIRLPEKATVLITVLAGKVPGDLQLGQQAVLDEARAWRARLTAAGVQTQAVDVLDEVRTPS